MLPAVKDVSPLEDHELLVIFESGESGVLDMKPYLEFGVFHRIKDITAFKQVHVSFDTIEWQSGVDLDPEFVYKKCRRDIASLPTV